MTDLTPLERERMTTIFRMTSLGINVRPLFILGLAYTTASVSCVPSMGRSYGEYHGRYTPRVSRRSPMQNLVKRRSWEKGERSEEHTSELQSLAYLVCRLLLEKKKKKKNIN